MSSPTGMDFTTQDPWRIFRIMAEFVDSFEVMSRIGPAVSVFGSARTTAEDPWYQKGEEVGRLLARAGYAAITGGGGIMEAVNRGAAAAGGGEVGGDVGLSLRGRPFSASATLARAHFGHQDPCWMLAGTAHQRCSLAHCHSSFVLLLT